MIVIVGDGDGNSNSNSNGSDNISNCKFIKNSYNSSDKNKKLST